MGRQLTVVVNGNAYEVEVGDLGASPVKVIVNGKEYDVEIEYGGGKQVPAPSSLGVPPATSSDVSVSLSKAPKPQSKVVSAGIGNEVTAPMPGTILDVAVKVGQKVIVGQQLCALDAMKMKSAIRSPREGVISKVEVINGQKVAYGDIIVRYE